MKRDTNCKTYNMGKLIEIKGKTCLITGGASGLGALYAEAFLRDGAKHVAILDIAEAVGKETTGKLNKMYPGRVTFIKCDVGDEDSVSKGFTQVIDILKKVDVLINNAGILNDSLAVWRKSCEVTWEGLVSFTLKAVDHMRKDEGGAGGTIVNIASTAALQPVGPYPIYCGNKAAVLHFSQSLAQTPFEETTGIRVLTICIAATDTTLIQSLDQKTYREKPGAEVTQFIASISPQKPESAVAALMTMFNNGTNGSVWVSAKDRPVYDITSKLLNFYNSTIDFIL